MEMEKILLAKQVQKRARFDVLSPKRANLATRRMLQHKTLLRT